MTELFVAVTAHFVATDKRVQAGRILHSEGLKREGKLFAFTRREDLNVKLDQERVAQLIADGTGSPIDAGKGRPMREWVVLRPTELASRTSYVGEALALSTPQ